MANPTSATSLPVVLEATSTEQEITIDPSRWHHLMHNGVDTALAETLNPIMLAIERTGTNPTVDNDGSEGPNKAILIAGKEIYLAPGVGIIAFRTAAGAPTFNVIPLMPDPWA